MPMYYEIYLDSLFLIQFGMNLYLLKLVNHSLHRTATRKRVLLGALAGSASSVLTFFLPIPVWLQLVFSFLVSMGCMLGITFRIRSLQAVLRVAEKLILFTFLIGSAVLLVIKWLPGGMAVNGLAVLALGGVVYEILRGILEAHRAKPNLCRVTLKGEHASVKVEALLDTGNHLREPISGKPVAVLDKSIFLKLYPEGTAGGFRVIPYRSIGKRDGILPGYLIPEIVVETDGVQKAYRDMYVGISQDNLSGGEAYRMILNPEILEAQGEAESSN